MGLSKTNYGVEIEYDREYNLLYLKVNPTVKSGIANSKTSIDPTSIANIAIYPLDFG